MGNIHLFSGALQDPEPFLWRAQNAAGSLLFPTLSTPPSIENMGGKHPALVERYSCSVWETAVMTLHDSQITSPIISVPYPLQATRMKSGRQEHPPQAPMSRVSWQRFVLCEEIRQWLGSPLLTKYKYPGVMLIFRQANFIDSSFFTHNVMPLFLAPPFHYSRSWIRSAWLLLAFDLQKTAFLLCVHGLCTFYPHQLLEPVGGCLFISKLFHLSSSFKKRVNLHSSNIISLKKERTHYFSDVSWSIAPLLETLSVNKLHLTLCPSAKQISWEYLVMHNAFFHASVSGRRTQVSPYKCRIFFPPIFSTKKE